MNLKETITSGKKFLSTFEGKVTLVTSISSVVITSIALALNPSQSQDHSFDLKIRPGSNFQLTSQNTPQACKWEKETPSAQEINSCALAFKDLYEQQGVSLDSSRSCELVTNYVWDKIDKVKNSESSSVKEHFNRQIIQALGRNWNCDFSEKEVNNTS